MTTMSDTKYLVIFYGVSAGQNGDNLGSDEQDLIMLIFLVINTEENKVSPSTITIVGWWSFGKEEFLTVW